MNQEYLSGEDWSWLRQNYNRAYHDMLQRALLRERKALTEERNAILRRPRSNFDQDNARLKWLNLRVEELNAWYNGLSDGAKGVIDEE